MKREPWKRRGRGGCGAHMWTESMRAEASATIGQRRRERSPSIHAASMQWSYLLPHESPASILPCGTCEGCSTFGNSH